MNRPIQTFPAQELIELLASQVPSQANLRVPATEADLLFLGAANLRALVRSLRFEATRLVELVKHLQDLEDQLVGGTTAAIAEAAAQFENPRLPRVGYHPDGENLLEPLDRASQRRARGATTFNVCGWCKYAQGGLSRYEYLKYPSCAFLEEAGFPDGGRPFDHSCLLPGLPDLAIKRLASRIAAKKDLLVSAKRATDEKIRYVISLARRASRKPVFPDQRRREWLKPDARVVCFVGSWGSRLIRDELAVGTAIIAPQRQMLDVRFDQRLHDGPAYDGYGTSFGLARAEVMLNWEYEYLRTHRDYASLWIWIGTDLDNAGFDPEGLQAALATGPTFRAAS